MTKILIDYLDIYTKYPADKFLTKLERKERHKRLTTWENEVYKTMPTFDEVVEFIAQNETLKFEKPFLMKVLIPRVKEDVEQGNINALKYLFECDDKERWFLHNGIKRDYAQKKYYIRMFCDGTDWKYSEEKLADLVLAHEPDNEIVLNEKYKTSKYFLDFSIHEVPWGILADMKNVAGKKTMPHMFNYLEEFAQLSKKLGKDDDIFIDKCDILYKAWEHYLNYINDYTGFKDYLIKHDIDY